MLDATRVMFLASGFEGVTMEGVAAEAGISKITLYKHFQNRDELIEALIGRESDWMEAETKTLSSPETLNLETITDFGVKLISFLARPDVMALDARMAQAPVRHKGAVARYFAAGPERLHKALAGLLAEARAAGLFRLNEPDVAAIDLMALWLTAVPLPSRLGLAPPPGIPEIDRAVRRATTLFVKAYAADRKTRSAADADQLRP
jgi:TetR/AcrR family transcriptional regulator, mexJK operon transcriptional repressor